MHSSRMCTDRLLTVCLLVRWVHPLMGASTGAGWGCTHRGVSRRVHLGASKVLPSPINIMTHACENINFPQTTYAVGKINLIVELYIDNLVRFTCIQKKKTVLHKLQAVANKHLANFPDLINLFHHRTLCENITDLQRYIL